VHIAFRTAQVRAREHAFGAILRETAGALTISSHQRAGEPAQRGNVRLDQRALIWHCGTFAIRRNLQPTALIGCRSLDRADIIAAPLLSAITFLLAKTPL